MRGFAAPHLLRWCCLGHMVSGQGTEGRRHYHSVRVQGGQEVHRPDVPVTLDVAAAKFNVGGPVVSGVCGERC